MQIYKKMNEKKQKRHKKKNERQLAHYIFMNV